MCIKKCLAWSLQRPFYKTNRREKLLKIDQTFYKKWDLPHRNCALRGI